MKINNINLMTSTEEVIRIFDDASQTAYDSYAIVWWQEEEPVIAEPYASYPMSDSRHFYDRELPANFEIL